jgi:hypothetical protein
LFFCNFFIFWTIFLYFLWTRNTWDGSIKSFSLNRVMIWSIENQERSLKSVQQLWSLRCKIKFWASIFFLKQVPRSWLDAKLNFTWFQKKVCPNPSYERKVMPVLRKGLRIRVFGGQKQGRTCRHG